MNFTKNKEINIPKQNYISNRSPQPNNKLRNYNIQSQGRSPIPNPPRNFDIEDNIEENININEYLNSKQTNFYQMKNKNKERSPENKLQNNNYFNYNNNFNNNYNNTYYPNVRKHFESDDLDDKNMDYKNNNINWKKKILEIKEQNSKEYKQYINRNYNNNNIYNYNNYFNGNYYNNNYNNGNNSYNPKEYMHSSLKSNEGIGLKKYDNYDNYKNYNKNKNKKRDMNNNNNINNNKNYQKYSQDHYNISNNNNYLSDNNFKKKIKNKNQTQDNYYQNKKNNNINQNNDSSSSNIYDDSYDYKTQYNFKKNPKYKYWDVSKFYSTSSQENSYSDINNNNKEEEVYNTTRPFRPPLKNDEEHYHQNLTIKIKNQEEQNKPPIKYVDNTPEGCLAPNINNIEKKNKKIRLNISNEEKIAIPEKLYERSKYYVETKKKFEFPDLNKYNKRINNNRSPENNNINNNEKNKKIKEITVDLSPKKKLNLSNSNQNIGGRRINKNNNNINNISTANNNDNKYNFNINPNTKIESCIITFDKNQKNNNPKYKLSNSLDRMEINKTRYIKKKVILTSNRKNIHYNNETPGMNNSKNKIYQKPGTETLSRSIGKPIPFAQDNLELSGEVKDYCAPSPDYGKKGKEAFLNSRKNNKSPILSSSGKYQNHIFDSNKKYDEFSFREENNDNNINDVNYDKNIKNKNKGNDNFSIFNQQKIVTFSNNNENDNNNNKNKDIEKNINNNISKLIIKSFSNKKKEIKEKPKLIYTFYKKYYDLYLQLPQKEKIYMIKNKEKEKDKSYEYNDIEKKIFDKKLTNAPLRGKILDVSAKNFYIRKKLNSSLNDDNNSFNYYNNNTIDIELLEESNNNTATKKNKFIIRTLVKKIKKKAKKEFYFKNNNTNINNININIFNKDIIKTKEQIKKEKKINSILKEDFENYIIYYKENINNNKNKKYDWSMIELLMIKIKLDIGDIINGYLKACEDIIIDEEYIIIGNDYINNIIEHYKNHYLTNNNFEEIHNKLIKIFAYLKEINIDTNFKYKILWGLLNILINNELFFLNDFDILKQTDEENKNEIKNILANNNDLILLEKINF